MRLIDADALQDEYVRLSGRELKLIDEAQTIDAEPVRHAYWMIRETDYWGELEEPVVQLKCSSCRTKMLTFGKREHAEAYISNIKYCDFCGAKMDGGKT